jgi:hypothetical protein
MYWPLGVASEYSVSSPGTAAAGDDVDREVRPLLALSASKPANLIVAVSKDELFVWQSQVCLLSRCRESC